MPVSHSSQALAEIGLIIFQLSIRTEGRRSELKAEGLSYLGVVVLLLPEGLAWV